MFEKKPQPTKAEKLLREAKRREEAALAMADREANENRARANMERLRAERLAREGG